jgi:hypothetical protein
MPNRFNVERALADDVEKARLNYEQARSLLNGLVADIPSHLPHPDGSLQIKNAGRELESARDAYTKALREFSAFTVNGEIPERLKKA